MNTVESLIWAAWLVFMLLPLAVLFGTVLAAIYAAETTTPRPPAIEQ